MSDREGRGAPSDDELSLPRATVAKMIQGAGSSSSDISFPPPSPYIPFICCGRRATRDHLELTLSSLHALPEPRRDYQELLPEDVACAKETRDLVIECCVGKTEIHNIPVALILIPSSIVEFIHLLSSEANEICEKESKKTIAPEHIISALQVPLSLRIVRLSHD